MFEMHVDSKGQPLANRKGSMIYSALTEEISNGRKKAGDQYTLKDSGKFYASFKILANGDGIIIEANRMFEDGTDIFEKYGHDILGLTDENIKIIIEQFADYVRAEIIEKIL